MKLLSELLEEEKKKTPYEKEKEKEKRDREFRRRQSKYAAVGAGIGALASLVASLKKRRRFDKKMVIGGVPLGVFGGLSAFDAKRYMEAKKKKEDRKD